MVGSNLESGIFVGKFVEGCPEFSLVSLGLGFDGQGNDWLGEGDRFKNNRFGFFTEGITGFGGFKANDGDDFAGSCLLDFFTIVTVHQQDAADTFAFAFAGVVDKGTLFESAGVDVNEGETTDVGIGLNLEGQTGEGFV